MDYQIVLEDIYTEVKPYRRAGHQADYIPALERVNPDQFGMSLTTTQFSCGRVGGALLHTEYLESLFSGSLPEPSGREVVGKGGQGTLRQRLQFYCPTGI